MSNQAKSSNRPGIGVNRSSLNPFISVMLTGTTATNAPKNPKIKDIMIDATTTGSIVTYVWDGGSWR